MGMAYKNNSRLSHTVITKIIYQRCIKYPFILNILIFSITSNADISPSKLGASYSEADLS